MHRETKLLHYGRQTLPGPANPPVVKASTILHDSVESYRQTLEERATDDSVLSYGRRGTTTAHALMQAISDMEGGDGCWLFPSGVAAIATTLQGLVHHGGRVLLTESAFHATQTVCDRLLAANGIGIDLFPWNATDLSAYLRPETQVVFVESPGSDTLEVMDLPAICKSAHAHGAIVVADNTYGSAWLYRPLELGCDVSIIAGTKYLSGHADVMMGAATAIGNSAGLLREAVLASGQTLAPDESYATLRGMRTLNLRLERHQENTLQVIAWLQDQDLIERVFHPSVPGHPGKANWERDACGTNGLVTIAFAKSGLTEKFINALQLIAIGSSWGGFESLAKEVRLNHVPDFARDLPDTRLVRLHIGLEYIDDIVADLERGLKAVQPAQ